jgi:hypothetical protein
MAKAKKLNTTVHLGNSETGESRVLGPNDKLSAADRKELEKNWGRRASEFLVDSDDDEAPEDVSAEDQLAAGHPHHDTALPAQDKGGAPRVVEAQEINQEAREGSPRGRSGK